MYKKRTIKTKQINTVYSLDSNQNQTLTDFLLVFSVTKFYIFLLYLKFKATGIYFKLNFFFSGTSEWYIKDTDKRVTLSSQSVTVPLVYATRVVTWRRTTWYLTSLSQNWVVPKSTVCTTVSRCSFVKKFRKFKKSVVPFSFFFLFPPETCSTKITCHFTPDNKILD